MATTPPGPGRTPEKTLIEAFLNRVTAWGERPAAHVKRDGKYRPVLYREMGEAVRNLALGLIARKVGVGDRVGILSENRIEWAVSDLAIQAAGGIPVPIYATSHPDQIQPILRDSGCKMVIASDEDQFRKLLAMRSDCPALRTVVLMEPQKDEAPGLDVMSYEALLQEGAARKDDGPIAKRTARLDEDDLATIIYTSGTTGTPKGVMLTHGNILSNLRTIGEIFDVSADDIHLSFLPLSHVLERTCGFYAMMYEGVQIAYAESIDKVAENIREIRPTLLIGVPRFYEKVHSRIVDAAERNPLKRRLFRWALGVSRRCRAIEREGGAVPALLGMQARKADDLVFSKIRERMGGRLRFLISGGAALQTEVAEFFEAVGVPILEGYGLTETAPVVAFNLPGARRIGTVGKPIPGVEVRIAEDGEILVRGPNVMRGYYRDRSATSEVLEKDGTFHTGDIGEFDDGGFLRITDRKKDILVTSGGKNIPPQKIESILKSDPLIEEAVVCGDGRNYLTGLIVPSFVDLERYARERKIPYYEVQDLVERPEIHSLVQQRIEELHGRLPRYEQIKKFTLLNKELSFEEGEMTPTMKVRRQIIYRKYHDEIERMYGPTSVGAVREAVPEEVREQAQRSRGTIDKAQRPRFQETLVRMFQRTVETWPRSEALWVPGKKGQFEPVTYNRLGRLVRDFGQGLIDLGVKAGEPVALFSDNRFEWLITDLAVISIGCHDVPRGADSTAQELVYILQHCEARVCVVEDEKQLAKIQGSRAQCPQLEMLIVLDEGYRGGEAKDVFPFDEVLRRGRAAADRHARAFDRRAAETSGNDLATVIYTSGTTGNPKGVMLTHSNLMHNVRVTPPLIGLEGDDRFLSILPSWHSFERIVEYVSISKGACIAYSKPFPKILMRDLGTVRPTFMTAVPRVLEAIHAGVMGNVRKQPPGRRLVFALALWVGARMDRARTILDGQEADFSTPADATLALRRLSARTTALLLGRIHRRLDGAVFEKIRERIGGRIRGVVSGGGALADHVENFYRAVGLLVLEGYGLTETSPVVAVRTFERHAPHTVGRPLPETEVRIVDEHRKLLPVGEKGIVHVRGPQVMKGYLRNPEATEKVLFPDGWFDTGDLGRLTIQGDLQITGRAKDTIVLLSGENVEPEPIEGALKKCPFISQVMVVGQDQKFLAALVIPDWGGLQELGRLDGVDLSDPRRAARDEKVRSLLQDEMKRLVNEEAGFRRSEMVQRFVILPDDFQVGEELTHTLKMKRLVIAEKYASEIEKLYEG